MPERILQEKDQSPRPHSRGALLLVDVRDEVANALRAVAPNEQIDVRSESLEGALGVDGRFDVVAVELHGSDESAVSPVRELRQRFPSVDLVALADDLPVDAVVRTMRLGVAEVIGLPAATADLVSRILGHVTGDAGPDILGELIGRSGPMRRLRREAASVAPMQSTVLLTGETGTGKGLVARTLHRLSPRADQPFVHVDCASLSPTVIESEFFGHEKGSFTGAAGRRAGRFELAGEGTIFLDEIADLDTGLQSKLLRVLQDREFERIGGTLTLEMNARVIAATSSDLRRAVEERRFRADLYFRLNVFRLEVPPLRDRIADVPLLVRDALSRVGSRLGVPVPNVHDDLYAELMGYHWPGNVREVQNVVERLLVQHPGETLVAEHLAGTLEPDWAAPLGPTAIPAAPATPAGPPPPRERRYGSDEERNELAAAVIRSGGNLARASRRLDMARSTLRYKIRQYELGHLIPSD